ncbi:cytochrome c oxidase subunit 7A-related protein, mitochondrial isoform X2 [Pseudorca crassidens]|uniref:cytochrome c oxidase subunit 7A-related protein, mitochondrial isoform X2 n=1 Tax=Pseudorca crassidens TaxID=82174 RepID=UPI00352EB17C
MDHSLQAPRTQEAGRGDLLSSASGPDRGLQVSPTQCWLNGHHCAEMGSRVRFDPSQDALWLGGTSGMKRDDQRMSFSSCKWKRLQLSKLQHTKSWHGSYLEVPFLDLLFY